MKHPYLHGAVLLALIGMQGCGGNDEFVPNPEPVIPDVVYTVRLSPAQEVADVASTASGTATLTVNPPTNQVTGTLTVTNMDATDAHIHIGAPGVSGPVTIPLTRGAAAGTWVVPPNTVLTAEQRAALDAGNLYFNAHSAAFPAGEIRGQIGREVMLARLSGHQENPPVASAGTGLGVISYDPARRTADLTLTYANITPTAAHVHTEAVGVNGPVTFDLGTPADNRFTRTGVAFTDAQLADFRAKRMYFNIHTAANPGGEIRGQVGLQVRVGTMTGAQEVPPNTSTATGLGFAAYDPDARTVYGQFTVTGFAPSDGHIHRGAPGVAGPVVIPFQRSPNNAQFWRSNGFVAIGDADARLLLGGGMYLNAHSATVPSGEIRGQLLPR